MDNDMLNDLPEILNIKQLQSILHVGRSTAYTLINNNTIKHFRIGTAIRVPKKHLIEYIEKSCYNTYTTGERSDPKEVSL